MLTSLRPCKGLSRSPTLLILKADGLLSAHGGRLVLVNRQCELVAVMPALHARLAETGQVTIVVGQLLQHILRGYVVGIVVEQTLNPRDVTDGSQRRSDRVCSGPAAAASSTPSEGPQCR